MANLWKKAFPLQLIPILCGLLEALTFYFAVICRTGIPYPIRGAILVAPAVLFAPLYAQMTGKKLYPRLYFGWSCVGFLLFGILYDWVVPEVWRRSFYSSLRLSLISLGLLLFAIWSASWETGGTEVSAEEWEQREREREEEERIRRIAEENARHQR